MASVSHELRTPLTCVSGFAETLRAHWDALSEDERVTFVDKICHHSSELGDLVERLLDFSQVEAGRLSAGIVCVELQSEVEATVAALGPLVAGRPLEIEILAPAVMADSVLLRRTLTNLLSGDIAPTSGTVTLSGRDVTGWNPERVSRAGLAPTLRRATSISTFRAGFSSRTN